MRKIILALSIASGLYAGFYIGIEGGYNTSKQVFDYTDRSTNAKPNFKVNLKGNGYVANLTLGSEHSFLDQYIVLRWGAFGGFGQTYGKDESGEENTLSTIAFGANADVIANFVAKENFTLGILAGVEYMYSMLGPNPERKEGAVIYKGYTNGTFTKEEYYLSNKTHSSSTVIRAGVSTLVKKHHRFDVFAKIPVVLTEEESSGFFASNINGKITKIDFTTIYQYQFIQALMSYKYVF